MTEPSGDAAVADARSPWADLASWPLRGGMKGGVLLLVFCALAMTYFEGGDTKAQRETDTAVRGIVGIVSLFVLGFYARRALVCTWPHERPVPWGRDEQDATSAFPAAGMFVAVAAVSFAPLLAWFSLRATIGVAAPLDWIVVFALAAFGAARLPLAYAATVVKDTFLAALPPTPSRMRRAEPHAARIASAASIAFVLLLIAAIAWGVAAAPYIPDNPDRRPPAYPSAVAAALFAVRSAAYYAGLVSFRVAGLLVRDVPEIGEALR